VYNQERLTTLQFPQKPFLV